MDDAGHQRRSAIQGKARRGPRAAPDRKTRPGTTAGAGRGRNEVLRLLSSACVITLTGPGRTGTSRLALLQPGGTTATFRMACRRNDMATSLEGLAWVAGSSGRRERAALLPGAGAALFEELGLHANVFVAGCPSRRVRGGGLRQRG